MKKFIDRSDAGKLLARQLIQYKNQPDVIVLALPRGGVPVAYEIAQVLKVPLDVFIVRKLGVPWHKELALGAIASGGSIIFNEDIIQQLSLSKAEIDPVIEAEKKELNRREKKYRGHYDYPNLANKTIILVDDGIATGASMRAAIKGIRQHQPDKIIVAVPAAAEPSFEEIKKLVDEIVCIYVSAQFYAVGAWYENFSQTTDEEVSNLLGNNLSKRSVE